MFKGFWANLRDLPRVTRLSAVVAGLLVVLVSYTGPLLVILEAAERAALSASELNSWIWVMMVGIGVSGILLSLWYRHPITTAWSAAGVALLVTSLPQYGLRQAVGAYILAALAITVVGLTRLFGRTMALVPQPIALGMLAGVLLRFGLNTFVQLPRDPLLIILMVAAFFGLRRYNFRAPALGALGIGLVLAFGRGQVALGTLSFTLAGPQLIWPEFTLGAALGLALPLFMLTITAQNAPGFAVLRGAGYDTPIDGPITVTGIASLLTAPFGSSGINLAAITAAICAGPEADPDPQRRYAAGVMAGIWYIIAGLLGTAAVSLFGALPRPLIAATAGLALISAIGGALGGALGEDRGREGALVAFLVTASDTTFLNIGAPFWGLIFGVAVHAVLHAGQGAGGDKGTRR